MRRILMVLTAAALLVAMMAASAAPAMADGFHDGIDDGRFLGDYHFLGDRFLGDRFLGDRVFVLDEDDDDDFLIGDTFSLDEGECVVVSRHRVLCNVNGVIQTFRV